MPSRLKILIFLLLIVSAISLYIFTSQSDPIAYFQSFYPTAESESEEVAPLPPPTPVTTASNVYQIPTGVQIYNFSHGENVKGPRVNRLTLSPIDPQEGTTQEIDLIFDPKIPVKSAKIELITDSKTTPLTLKEVSSDEQGYYYHVSHTFPDTYQKKYALHFVFRSDKEVYDDTMYLR